MLLSYVAGLLSVGSRLSVGVSLGVGESSGSWLGVTSALGAGVVSGSPCGAGAGSGVVGSTLEVGVSSVVSTVGSSVPADANVPYIGIAPTVNTTASIRHSSLPDLEKLFRFLNLVSSLS